MPGPHLMPSPCGLADTKADTEVDTEARTHVDAIGDALLGAWDDFLAVVRSADLNRPSRLPGWTGRATCLHLGSWDDHPALVGLVAAAQSGGGPRPQNADDRNAAVVAAHQGATTDETIAALERSRDVLAAWFDTEEPAALAAARVYSTIGELPLLSLVHAGCYELAVHALDLGPCGAESPSEFLLGRGLAALMDVTGALSSRAGIDITVTAATGVGGWSFTSTNEGWTTQPVPTGPFVGAGVRGTAADLLDASAGRAALPSLLVQRRLVVQQLASFMRLAPLVNDVPGLPGGQALKAGLAGIGGVTRLLGRLRR